MVAALTFFLSNDPSQNKEEDGNSSEEEEKKDKAKKISGMVRAAGVSLRRALVGLVTPVPNCSDLVNLQPLIVRFLNAVKGVVGLFALASCPSFSGGFLRHNFCQLSPNSLIH